MSAIIITVRRNFCHLTFPSKAANLNAAFVLPNGSFVTPPFARALNGTTVRRSLALLASAIASSAKSAAAASGSSSTSSTPPPPPVASVAQRRISEAEARTAVEVILLAGDTHLFAVTSWDDAPVGDGAAGPVARWLHTALIDEAHRGDNEHITVPYEGVEDVDWTSKPWFR